MKTCLPESENFSYMMLNLVGEVGELASKVAKAIRKGQVYIDENDFVGEIGANGFGEAQREALQKEAGDILWQLSGLCCIMGWPLEDVARQNLDKLADRQSRRVIDGSGDER